MGITYSSIYNSEFEFKDLVGMTIKAIIGAEKDSEEIFIKTECGRFFKIYHDQDCCECVLVDDVCGDIEDIIGSEIIHFEERTNQSDEDSDKKPFEYSESFTWTFYDIQTKKGSLNIKWFGESNGYYSESVDIVEGFIASV